jgi:hypothetical protein
LFREVLVPHLAEKKATDRARPRSTAGTVRAQIRRGIRLSDADRIRARDGGSYSATR